MRNFKFFYVTSIALMFLTLATGMCCVFAADYTFSNYAGQTIEGYVGDAIYKDFRCEIGVSVDVPDDETPDAVVKLYDANNNLISATPLYAVGENYYYDAAFEVPNEDKEYIIELYLVDENGNQISDVQKWNYTFRKYEIEYGYIYEKGLSTGLSQNAVIYIRDTQGKETEYTLQSNLIFINNEHINTGRLTDEELLEMIEAPSYAQFVTNRDGKIKILNFDTTAQPISGTSYDKETNSFENVMQSNVPVYYTPYQAGEMWEHISSENYYYELEVYDYAIVITGFDSKNYPEEVITYEFSENINARFSCGISFTLNTSNEKPKAVVNIYDVNNNLVSVPLYASGVNYCYDANFEIPNEDKEYIIELYLVDENGNQISDVQKWNYTFKKYEIEYGYIYEKGLSTGLSQNAVIYIRDTQGKETEYVLQNSIMWIDGEKINCKTISEDELLGKINTDCYVEFILNKDGTIKMLNFADFHEDSYSVFRYNYIDTDLVITSAHILPEEIKENSLVICAFYNNGILADVKMQKAIGEKIHFYTDVNYDNIKFMVWSDLSSLIPTDGFKDINTSLGK